MNNQFEYDFFVSYRHREPDKSWVRKKLVPALEERGLRGFIDYRDFRLGAALVKEMARAVEHSRYTLAVVTSTYLQSNFTELENVMAEHLGLENSQIRLIGIIREAEAVEKARLNMRASLMLDMTDDDLFEEMVERLAAALQQPPDR